MSLINILRNGDNGCYSVIFKLKYEGDKEVLTKYHSELKKVLSDSSSAHWDVAFCLARLVRSGSWTSYYQATLELGDLWNAANPGKDKENPYRFTGGNAYCTHSVSFFTFLKVNFGLGRTTVYNYLNVVDEFSRCVKDDGDKEEYSINAEAREFQFWQLVEMLSLTYQERLKVQPSWTREEIRAYKKSLREPKSEKVQPAEQVEVEDKPRTEAQQRFAKYSKDDLINELITLEEKYAKLTAQVDELVKKAYPYAKKNGNEAKHELQGIIENLLNSYPYEIHLHGRKQGFKAFAGVVAGNILSSYNVNVSEPIQEKIPV